MNFPVFFFFFANFFGGGFYASFESSKVAETIVSRQILPGNTLNICITSILT